MIPDIVQNVHQHIILKIQELKEFIDQEGNFLVHNILILQIFIVDLKIRELVAQANKAMKIYCT